MFGPSSSPPIRVSNGQEEQLKGALLPAFGFECSDSFFSKPREFVRPKSGFLPTPIPTSEANMQASSPPHSPSAEAREIPRSKAFESAVSPASNSLVCVVRVPTNGDKVTIGRSSKSSSFALRASNRLASRVHASLWYDAAHDRLSIQCLGWNGLLVNVPGCPESNNLKNSYEIERGQILNVEGIEGIVLDIHGDRASVQVANDAHASEVTEDEAWSVMGSSPLKGKRNSISEETNAQMVIQTAAPKLESPIPFANELVNKHSSVEPVSSEDVTLADKTTVDGAKYSLGASSPVLPSDLPTDVLSAENTHVGPLKTEEFGTEELNADRISKINESMSDNVSDKASSSVNKNVDSLDTERPKPAVPEHVKQVMHTDVSQSCEENEEASGVLPTSTNPPNKMGSDSVKAVEPLITETNIAGTTLVKTPTTLPEETGSVKEEIQPEESAIATKPVMSQSKDSLASAPPMEQTKPALSRSLAKASLSRSSSRAASEDPEHDTTGRKIRRQFEPISEQTKMEYENVIVNLIAFSRSSAVPLNSVRKANHSLYQLPKRQVMSIVEDITCIGVIEGAVEDTTARKADDEYYYIPERDSNEERRRAVQGTRGHRSLRNCRKTSKQYYYRPLQLD